MTTAQVVKTSVTVNNNSPIQDYVHPDDQTQPTFEMYSTVCRCLLVVLLFFLALLHNHCYYLHKTKSRLVISIWQGPGLVATKIPFFHRISNPMEIFSAPAQEENLFFLSGRSAQKKLHNFRIKSSHFCRTSRHVWLSSSTCGHCYA